MHTFVYTRTHNSHSLCCRKGSMGFGLDGDRVSSLPLVNAVVLESYSVLIHLAERAARRVQWEASTDNVGAEHFQGTWVVWFLEQ